MRKQRDGIFRCRMASTGTIVTGVILCGVCLLVLIILSEELGFNVITGILVSPIIAYIIILATNIILESTTVFTIMPDRIILSRFGKKITQIMACDITKSGTFIRFNNRSRFLYITAEEFKQMPEESKTEMRRLQFYTLKKTMNKKNAKSIGIQETAERVKAMEQYIPGFDSRNIIAYVKKDT